MFTRQRTSFPSICVRSTRSLPLVAVPSLTSMRLLSHATGDGPRLQLERLRELMQKAAGTNSLLEKQAIIAGYPDLRRLLDMTYDNHLRYYMSSGTIQKAIYSSRATLGSSLSSSNSPTAPTLEALLEQLNRRELKPHQVYQFLQDIGIKDGADVEGEKLSLWEVFMRVLDKNLKVGIAGSTIQQVQRPGEGQHNSAESPSVSQFKADDASASASNRQTQDQPAQEHKSPAYDSATFLPEAVKLSPALGKTVLREDLPSLFSAKSASGDWYASRKLDGVRCLVFVDVAVPAEPKQRGKAEVVGVRPYSRTGKTFYTLGLLEEEIKASFAGWTGLCDLLANEKPISTYTSSTGEALFIKRLILDGELCMIRESEEEGGSMIEDFQGIVGLVRRKQGDVPGLTMFLLDCLPWSEVESKVGQPGREFRTRIEDCRSVVGRMKEVKGDAGEHVVLRELTQVPVDRVEDVEHMVAQAAEEGWEGLIIRKDIPYEGKRTSAIRKYKAWLDDEYIVKDVELNTMRLPVGGVFADRLGLASIWIEHKGTKVSVGSGFTVTDRLRFAENPDLIIGKQITVEYFGESTSEARDKKGGGSSLRFPRVKTIWEDGKRDI